MKALSEGPDFSLLPKGGKKIPESSNRISLEDFSSFGSHTSHIPVPLHTLTAATHAHIQPTHTLTFTRTTFTHMLTLSLTHVRYTHMLTRTAPPAHTCTCSHTPICSLTYTHANTRNTATHTPVPSHPHSHMCTCSYVHTHNHIHTTHILISHPQHATHTPTPSHTLIHR